MPRKLPDWFKAKLIKPSFKETKKYLDGINTVCVKALCPNKAECFSAGTATFLLMGEVCTRHCLYCNISSGTPKPLKICELQNILDAVKNLSLAHVVITSVTRDDIIDGGAAHLSSMVRLLKKNSSCTVELLIPDFKGSCESIAKIVNSSPDIIGHNIEAAKPFFRTLRPQGSYALSLSVLKNIKSLKPSQITKSGLMVGFGESMKDIRNTLQDLASAKVDMLTIGQYLQPTPGHFPVEKYYAPEEFEKLRAIAERLGFKHVESGPLVRSSYHAHGLV